MAHPTVEDVLTVLTDPNFNAAAQPSDADPVRINPTRVRIFLHERGATVDEAEDLINQALQRVGGWKDTEVLPPFQETSASAPTPEVVELFLVPAAALRT